MTVSAGESCTIRPVNLADGTDRAAIRGINARAFPMARAGSFEKALAAKPDVIARVAVDPAGRIVGHVIFTPVSIALNRPSGGYLWGMGLGELAVLPDVQRQGVGGRLTRAGLDALRLAGCPFCIVVGHAEYYPRFGFVPGSRQGLRCQWGKIPDRAFMVRILDGPAMRGVSGTARFRDVD